MRRNTIILTADEIQKCYIGNDKYILDIDQLTEWAKEGKDKTLSEVFDNGGIGKRINPLVTNKN